jgi:hypothetical protein
LAGGLTSLTVPGRISAAGWGVNTVFSEFPPKTASFSHLPEATFKEWKETFLKGNFLSKDKD